MRLALLALALVGLMGCESRQSEYQREYERDEDRHAQLNPPGRYQMSPAPDGRVYVLDTGDGSIRLCGAVGPESNQRPMGCGPAATQ